ncbi:hypothetical protein P22_0847 [Propionispora sp. 2/2-37]|uniref:HD domain-containing phosphohydrolase n=1 Tax=Propionispora sp. 2/2-37 TaxID=1677858 RepID=UPI0006BB86BA|nr:HD domain-containing phosphohydrolase [Propionispora sp. 2/2-37]CUH94781.1 hypothetical protein P22_0847 [Propionispora sp. 2/2-37]
MAKRNIPAATPPDGLTMESYSNIVEQAPDIILVVALDGSIMYANRAAVTAYQYSKENLYRLRLHNLSPATEEDLTNARLEFAIAQGILYRTRHYRRNGQSFPVEVSASLFHFSSRSALITVIRDITETMLIEENAHKLETSYHVLHTELMAAHEELAATHEELLASEEELRQQFDELLSRDEAIRYQNDLLHSLHETSIGLMQHLGQEDILEKILHYATELTETVNGFIFRLEQQNNKQMFLQSHGLGIHKATVGMRISCNEGISGMVFQTGEYVLVNDYPTWYQHTSPPAPILELCTAGRTSLASISSMLQVPLKRNGAIIGTIGLSYTESNKTFNREKIEAISQFADLASIALDNAILIASYQQELSIRRQTENKLRKAQANNQALLNSIPDPLFIVDRSGKFLDYKPGREIFMIDFEQLLKKNIRDILPNTIAAKAMQCLDQAFATGTIQLLEYQLPVNRKISHYEARIIASDANEALIIVRNITDRKRLVQQLKKMSLHDSLTGVYNRAFFEKQMNKLPAMGYASIGLLVCDVDGLKVINDTLGHSTGDNVLKRVARILRQSFRHNGIIARIGGDEFVVLLANHAIADFEAACHKIQELIARYNKNNPTLPISLSLGYAVSQTAPDMNALFKEADNNMYREKLHRQKSAKNAIVQALIKALEARDYLTEGHGERLQGLVEAFAKKLNLPDTVVADFKLLAHFHDIGKVGIPDSILFKPGSLSDEEWAVMRQHCEIGYRIANSAPDLAPIADWILTHHEWWNGQGYPQGMTGENIPLACRILALADTYDAMTNDRPYRKALSHQEAVTEIKKYAGIQFDPVLADRFIHLVNSV